MGKDKLKKFREIDSFENVLQLQEGQPFKGSWAKGFFRNENPLVLELACGKGEYAVNLARAFPERNFIGIDFKGNRIWRGAKTALEEGLSNVAFLRIRIEDILAYFDHQEVSEIWITFPDPQPQKSREKKRLTTPFFLGLYKQILVQNGVMHLKTDSFFFHDYTCKKLAALGLVPERMTTDLYNSEFVNEELKIQTFYERKYLQVGCPINYLSWRFSQANQ